MGGNENAAKMKRKSTKKSGKGKKGYVQRIGSVLSIHSYLIFFVNVCALSAISILLYANVVRKFGNNLYDWRAILAVIVNILFMSALVSTIDGIRRRLTMELPLIRILDGLEQISQGRYGYQIEPPYTRKINEFDDIIDSINELSKELADTETLKTDFVANVTHEMKTPLAIILNHASLLQNGNLTKEEQEEYLQALVNAYRRLNGLVVNMLKLNKLEKQNIYPEKKRYNVGEQLRNTFLSYEGAWSDKELDIDIDVDDIEIECDEGLLEIVWSNLISNAVKFTPKGGLLKLMLKEEGETVMATVQDGGCGMDAATGKHIFDKFYQGDTSHAKEGNGLGLAMVKRVIDIISGDIWVNSKVGVGTTFTVIIPKQWKETEKKAGGAQ